MTGSLPASVKRRIHPAFLLVVLFDQRTNPCTIYYGDVVFAFAFYSVSNKPT